ncbi:hypothetical protein BD413DRAFT_33389 [Trametes elegans]|nr:hypothetical protein BD413DRAFT_33389 [Trametes elegans]
MRNTAESLHLPMETAPLAQMAHGVWPRLTTLYLQGFYLQPVLSTLSSLLAQMPELRTLSVQAAQSPASSRAPILGKDGVLQVAPILCSLTVAYPDPQDAIFSLPSTNLTRLSLRDWPRYYISRYSQRCQLLPDSWVAPILTATECLHILERMDLPRLQSLEVVYEVDDEDERLLHRISTCYPHLSDLEIHRYRKNDHREVVPHQHIAHTLGSIPHLRRLRLNLRFPNEPIPFYGVDLQRRIEKRRVLDWDNHLCGLAWEIFDAVGANTRPDFEHLALLYHDSWENLWVYFSIEHDEDGPCQHVDWGFPLSPGQLDWEIPPGQWPEYAGYSY